MLTIGAIATPETVRCCHKLVPQSNAKENKSRGVKPGEPSIFAPH